MGQPWDNIYYKHKGKGDAICDLIARNPALSYDKLNARNEPLVMASTPLWSIPIAYTEDNHIFKAIPMIARKTVLRVHSNDGKTRLRLVQTGGSEPPKAKLLVSRKFVETIDETPLEVELYLEAPAPHVEAYINNPNELTCDYATFQEIIDNGIARGWWSAPPEYFIINDRTLTLAPTNGYAVDGSWLIGFLLACRDPHANGETYDNLTPQIDWYTISHTPMGRYVTPDQPDKIKAVIQGGGGISSNATISICHNTQRYGHVMISGLVNGYFTCSIGYTDTISLIIHASKPYAHMTGAEREQALSVRFFSSSDLGETFTSGPYTFTYTSTDSSGWLIYEMVARAGVLFRDSQTLSIALPKERPSLPDGSYAVDTDIASMTNLDGKACFDPAWYLTNTQ